MQHARTPGITQEIERRIRRAFYAERLPSCRALAAEFRVARQTLTEALRPLVGTGLLRPARRNGIAIDRTALRRGKVIVVTTRGPNCRDENTGIAPLMRQIDADGLEAVLLSLLPGAGLPGELPADTLGMLFVNSALTVETAEYLDRQGIVFVSCNQLPSYPRLNVIDFDNLASCRALVQAVMAAGYTRFGMIFSGHLEGYNDLFRSNILRLKRQLGVPHEAYDDVVVDWSAETDEIFRKTLIFMAKKHCYPEVLLCFCAVSESMERTLEQPELRIPEDMLILAMRRSDCQFGGRVRTYAAEISSEALWLQGYQLLREAVFTPGMTRTRRLVKQEFRFDAEIPVKRRKS